MRKEVLVAILLGCAVGAVVAFGLWRANKALQEKPQQFIQNQTPKNKEPQPDSLVVASPEKDIVVSEAKVNVEGTTKSESLVTISTAKQDVVVEANAKGEFSAEIELDAGANLIKVVSVDKEGNKEEIELAVVYSTELE